MVGHNNKQTPSFVFLSVFAQNSTNTVSQHTNLKHCVQHRDSAAKIVSDIAKSVDLKTQLKRASRELTYLTI